MTNPENSSVEKRPMILGIGGAGAAIAGHLSLLPGIGHFQLAVIDTDKTSVENSSAPIKLIASADWGTTGGSGCGGDVIRGERAIARERRGVTEILSKASSLTVCGGLGGGTATGGIRTIASVARSLNLPAVYLLTTPFSFETYSRRSNADACIRELLPVTDILLTLPNDLLFATLSPDISAELAFEKSALEMAYLAYGVAELMCSRNVIGAGYADFMRPVKGVRCDCSIGIGAADANDGLDRCAVALERMLASPFLGGLEQLRNADAVFTILSGGTDLQFSELKRTFEHTANLFPKRTELLSGASVSDSMNGRIQLTVIAIKYEMPPEKKNAEFEFSGTPVPEPPIPGIASGGKPKGILMQEEFELTSYSRGIFENLPPTKYQDEDLDIPTYQRRNVSIDRGKTGNRS